jgi:phosphate transport system substrate-binding protein
MKKSALLVAALACAAISLVAAGVSGAAVDGGAKANAGTLTGAGATFPFPLISKWIPAYDQANGTQINYSPIGSGGGIAAITARTVDFGASDAPLSPDQFTACKGCVQIPWALSATAVIYNVPGAPQGLKLSPAVIAQMYLGFIKKWNSPSIRKDNPGVNLPDLNVTPVYRSDSSGTTYNFTDFLSKTSTAWKSRVGNSTSVNWPTGIGARGSAGVAGVVSRTEGGVMYADVAYALANKLKFATRLPDLDLHVRARSDGVLQGRRATEVHLLGDHVRPEVRAAAPLRAAAEERARVRLQADQEDPGLDVA